MRLVDEDMLVPIAWVDDALWFNVRGRRRFARLDQFGYKVYDLDSSARYFLGAAEGVIVRSAISRDQERIALIDLREPSVDLASGRPLFNLAPAQRLRAIVPAGDGSPCLWIREGAGARASFRPLGSGEAWHADVPATARVVRCLPEGIVCEDERGWSVVVGRTVVRSGPGRVVSVSGDHLLIREARTKDTCWYLVRSDRSPVPAPVVVAPGWFTVSAAAGAGRIVAYAVDREGDQAIWTADADKVAVSSGETQVWRRSDAHQGSCVVQTTTGAVHPTVRGTGLAVGSYWTGVARLQGVAPPMPIKIERVSIDGMPCLLACGGGRRRGVVIVFHGGPDSHELDDLRYGGAYRRMVARGLDILIVNYPGSLGFGRDFQRLSWHRWAKAIERAGDALDTFLQDHDYRVRVALGVSFGAWVAAQAVLRMGGRRPGADVTCTGIGAVPCRARV